MPTFKDAQIAHDMMRDSRYGMKDQVARIVEELDDIEVLENAIVSNIDFEELRLHLNNPDKDFKYNLIGEMICEAVDKYLECEISRINESLQQESSSQDFDLSDYEDILT